jgi:pimeloyl-ACP methyl ester carboxylesterase
VIAFDLPGHGKSSDALDPERSYNLTAYAEVASEVFRQLKVNSAIVFGASLGGHVGYELVALAASIKEINIKSLLIADAPPFSGIP